MRRSGKIATSKSMDAITLPIVRAVFLREFLRDGADIDFAACVADGFVNAISLEDLVNDNTEVFTSDAGQQRMLAIANNCRVKTA